MRSLEALVVGVVAMVSACGGVTPAEATDPPAAGSTGLPVAGSSGLGGDTGTGGSSGALGGASTGGIGTSGAGMSSAGTSGAGTSGSGGIAGAGGMTPSGWRLVWSDEFEGTGLPNPADWSYEVGLVRNDEEQYFTESRLENARQEGGMLVIEARQEAMGGAEFTSASLTTLRKHDFLYGRLEVRAKIPGGVGTWPAIWLFGVNRQQVGWPQCGEIDMMENVGFEPNLVHCTIHNAADQTGSGHNAIVSLVEPFNNFYVYAIEWYEDRIDMFVDGGLAYTYQNDGMGSTASWPYAAPSYLIMNLAIGGVWGGLQGIDTSIFPRRLSIDYVRYYEQE